MAIIKGVEVVITVDGEPLQEYDGYEKCSPDHDAFAGNERLKSSEARNYVEVQADTKFQIRCSVQPDFVFGKANCVSFDTTIDGKFLADSIMMKSEPSSVEYDPIVVKGFKYSTNGRWRRRPFVFGQPSFRSRNNETEIRRDSKRGMGSIRVTVWLEKGVASRRVTKTADTTMTDKIAKKVALGSAIEFCTKLGEASTIRTPNFWHTTKVGDRPKATFVFYYRSKEALMSIGIVERPIPLEDRLEEDLTPTEARELVKHLKAREKTTNLKIKQEKAENNLRQLKSLKRSHSTMETEDDSDIEEIARPEQFKRRAPSIHEEIL